MIDALCHLELYASPEEAARALADAATAGVTDVVSAGTDPLRNGTRGPATHDDERVQSGRPRVHRAFGIHPERVDEARLEKQLAALARLLDGADRGPRAGSVVAVGECGLDARRGLPPLDVQERAFRAQIDVARARGLPLIVHGVRAPQRVLAALDGAGVRFVWHGFSGSLEVAEAARKIGGLVSVGAAVLDPRRTRVRAVAASAAGADCLLETDAPDVPLATLAAVAAEVARLRGEAVADVVDRSSAAARSLYGVGPS